MVGVRSRREQGRATPFERVVGLEGIGLGLSKILLGPSTLPNPFLGDRGLPRVRGPGQALPVMLLGPPESVDVGKAGYSLHVLVLPYDRDIICRVHLGRGVVDAGKRVPLAWDLRHEHHHGRIWGESSGRNSFHTVVCTFVRGPSMCPRGRCRSSYVGGPGRAGSREPRPTLPVVPPGYQSRTRGACVGPRLPEWASMVFRGQRLGRAGSPCTTILFFGGRGHCPPGIVGCVAWRRG